MRRIRLIIEYDGTCYVGWQTQPNGIAVQQVIEEQLKTVTGSLCPLHASGRTDSGVHAFAQVAHFDTDVRMPADKFAIALNCGLPKDIRIQYSDEAPECFHSRFSAKRKQYRYCLQLGPHSHVFTRNSALHIHTELNVPAMQEAAKLLEGEHDFSAFKSSGSTIDNAVRTIYRSEWIRKGEHLYYEVEGNGFLYNMVRIIVGSMLEIGKDACPPAMIQTALESGKRSDAGTTAPPHGLMLARVMYPGFDTADHVGLPCY